MRSIKFLPVITFVLAAAFIAIAQGTAPELINYQGKMTDSADQLIDGQTVDIKFTFYGTASGSTAYLAVLQEDVTVNKGIFNVQIGSGSITPGTENKLSDVFAKHRIVWMGVTVGADEEMTPRYRIGSHPYALSMDLDPIDKYFNESDYDCDSHTKPVFGGDDCNDHNVDIHPGASEVCDDGIDNDCDKAVDNDDSDCP